MDNIQIAEMLKDKIKDIEESIKDENKHNRIVTIHLGAEVFLKMAKLFILIHKKQVNEK